MSNPNDFNGGPGMPPPAPAPNQGGGMYNPVLENLIEMALADGELTEKEKQVLFKRAQAQGIDLDEFEMVLDAKLYEKKKSLQAATPAPPQPPIPPIQPTQSAPKSDKIGDIRKCPNCGSMIGSFVMMCPDCGYEFSGVGANSFVENFAEGLRVAIEKCKEKKDGGLFGSSGLIGGYMKLLGAGDVVSDQMMAQKLDKAEAEYLKMAPLPRTKEDCVEMLNYALPKLKSTLGGNDYLRSKAWKKYFEAVLSKLEVEAINNKELGKLVEYYKEQIKSKRSIFGFKR